jgi:hypothetical protein
VAGLRNALDVELDRMATATMRQVRAPDGRAAAEEHEPAPDALDDLLERADDGGER